MSMKALSTLFSPSANAGKRPHIPRTAYPAVLAAFSIGLLLTGWTAAAQTVPECVLASAQAPSAANPSAASLGHESRYEWLRILAFANAPVVGADVSVSAQGSEGRPEAEFKAATNDQGAFPAYVHSHRRFRVTISGGTINERAFYGQLSADVVLTDPAHQVVVVNPVTTLVSLVLDARPELDLGGAQALVRRFLRLPENYSLGLALRQSSGYRSPFFSPVLFMEEAQAAGGLDALEQRLLRELLASHSSRHSFANPTALGTTGESSFATSLAMAVLKPVGSALGGWVVAQTGLETPDSTDSDIKILQDEILDLQSSVENLTKAVSDLTFLVENTATLTQYNDITADAQGRAIKVCSVQSSVYYLALECPPLPAGSSPSLPSSFCVKSKADLITDLNDTDITSAYDYLESFVGDNYSGVLGTHGMLHLYSLWLGRSKPFFRPADSTKMQNLYDYWDGVLTQAASLKAEHLHWQGEQCVPFPPHGVGPVQLIALLGNPAPPSSATTCQNPTPNTDPPSTGELQNNQAANIALMFPTVPEGTVIETQSTLMWATDFPMLVPPIPGFLPATCPTAYGPPFVPAGYGFAGGPSFGMSFDGLPGWTSPTQPVMLGLFSGWSAPTTTYPTPMSWLIAQSNAVSPDMPTSDGFFNILACANGVAGFFPNVWTTTNIGSSAGYISPYALVNINNGQVLPKNSSAAEGDNWQMITRHLAQGEQYFWTQ